ncbi:MAG TPA: hypothetical protein VGP93_09465, partial [Polyangiaceae bacterium]|nr:hypothetical protein [Polyangiaceae bacterium]
RGMLLKKPLEQRAGGYYHGATTKLGHRSDNVFASQADPEYQVLLDWVRGATEAADCLDPGAAP